MLNFRNKKMTEFCKKVSGKKLEKFWLSRILDEKSPHKPKVLIFFSKNNLAKADLLRASYKCPG
jgi:hypothetical protein